MPQTLKSGHLGKIYFVHVFPPHGEVVRDAPRNICPSDFERSLCLSLIKSIFEGKT
jgi:hypothetical protein